MPSATPTRTTPRRRARELVLQGLYQRQLAGNDLDDIRAQLVDDAGYARADHVFFGELWNGVARDFDPLLEALAPLLDRQVSELSPIERAIIAIGAWELANRLDTPYKVVINEAVELAKRYGSENSGKFINGALGTVAARITAGELTRQPAEA
jgi:N utilization substance protein B